MPSYKVQFAARLGSTASHLNFTPWFKIYADWTSWSVQTKRRIVAGVKCTSEDREAAINSAPRLPSCLSSFSSSYQLLKTRERNHCHYANTTRLLHMYSVRTWRDWLDCGFFIRALLLFLLLALRLFLHYLLDLDLLARGLLRTRGRSFGCERSLCWESGIC